VHCPLADREHAASLRQYAHVFHRTNVICIASAFAGLPETHQLGIALHEVGHVLAGERASERAATRAVERESGIRIEYLDSSSHGDALEWIAVRDKRQAIAFLRDFIREE